MPEQYDSAASYFGEIGTKINDLEERQRLLKERLILVGQNLIETKEVLGKDVLDIKVLLEGMKQDLKRVKDAVLRLSEEMDKRARKSEVDLLTKQMKMFQPLMEKI